MLARLLRVEPVAWLGFGAALETLLVLLGADKVILGAIGGVLVAAAAVVRQMVAPLPHVVEVTKDAAHAAAKATAEALSPETVGSRGELGGTALGIATEAAGSAADAALRDLGVDRKDRAA